MALPARSRRRTGGRRSPRAGTPSPARTHRKREWTWHSRAHEAHQMVARQRHLPREWTRPRRAAEEQPALPAPRRRRRLSATQTLDDPGDLPQRLDGSFGSGYGLPGDKLPLGRGILEGANRAHPIVILPVGRCPVGILSNSVTHASRTWTCCVPDPGMPAVYRPVRPHNVRVWFR